MFLDSYVNAKKRRLELLETIAAAADEIAQIDKKLPIMKSIELEADLLQAEENALQEMI